MMDDEIDVTITRLGFWLWGYKFYSNGHVTCGLAASRRSAKSIARRKAWVLWGKTTVFNQLEKEDAR